MDSLERVRLLYVACTRARDHLVVSLHRKIRQTEPDGDSSRTSAELLAGACADAPSAIPLDAVPASTGISARSGPATEPPPPYEDWCRDITRIRERAAWPAAMSASQLEGSQQTAAPRPAAIDRLGEPTDPGLAKDARDLGLPPWNKGRYGTAIGRAVHGVLQTVDLATGRGLDDAVAAQVLAEGVAEHGGIVAQLVRAALGSAAVQRAASRPHWRETYVGTVIGERVLEGFIDLIYRDDGLVIVATRPIPCLLSRWISGLLSIGPRWVRTQPRSRRLHTNRSQAASSSSCRLGALLSGLSRAFSKPQPSYGTP